jgi:DNA-binding PadR family transcriptional regulator
VLPRLERDGFATARSVAQTNKPDKRLYKISKAGRRVLREWLEDVVPGDAELFYLKAFLGGLMDRDTLIAHYEQFASDQQARLDELRAIEPTNTRRGNDYSLRSPAAQPGGDSLPASCSADRSNDILRRVDFVTDVERRTRSRFFGEPTGGAPNQWGDAAQFRLPNVGVRFYLPRYHVQRSTPDDPRVTTEPHVRVDLSSADWFAGCDPVLEAALR